LRAVECAEPLAKPGKITADLFAAVVKDLPKNPLGLTYTERVPDGCGDLVKYIWNEAYPAGADPSVGSVSDLIFMDSCSPSLRCHYFSVFHNNSNNSLYHWLTLFF